MSFAIRTFCIFPSLTRPAHLLSIYPQLARPAFCISDNTLRRQNTSIRKHCQMTSPNPVVAVLYQALPPPMYGGVSKPPKPGGYRDSGSDVAYALKNAGITVLTPVESPDPANQDHWCFPDTEEGILEALHRGATHLWANTVLFAGHPIQASTKLTPFETRIRVVGQPPLCADRFDDKSFVNDELRRYGGLTLPRSWTVDDPRSRKDDPDAVQQTLDNVLATIQESDYPIVAKPVRGRGSHGVKICRNSAELNEHVARLLDESPRVLLEEYLPGEEGTITIMPPSPQPSPQLAPEIKGSGIEWSERHASHWALPPVTRFNHVDGIAPYSGKVAVTVNSRAVSAAEIAADPGYLEIMKQCEKVGNLLQTAAPLRIDIRRFGPKTKFALFDINMKPNITGPGRPGRDNQTSLMGLAAGSMGWDYPKFLQYVLGSAQSLCQLRNFTSPLLG